MEQSQNCYWDSKCSEATKCEQFRYNTDQDCRKALSTCTVNTNQKVCQEASECSEYQIEGQCIQNRLQTQSCYWNGKDCVERICINAPSDHKTDLQCSNFLSTCTTTGEGCVLKTVCSAAQVKEACQTDINGNICFWNDEIDYCFDKNQCSYAPQIYKSNRECKNFLSFCITKEEGGCVTNQSCSSANIEQACEEDRNGNRCFWKDNVCSVQICENAPTTIYTNEDCEQFLPNKNCITKNGGGCTTNTTCNQIKIAIACIKNAQGNECFWDQDTCKDKQCDQYLKTTHEECQKFQDTCTVNLAKTGCIDWVCSNSLEQQICEKKGSPQKQCNWRDSYCQKKVCSLAPSSYKSHQECKNYLESCTLNNIGYGCMTIPLKCEAITIEEACINNGCGWNGQFCIDQSCDTANKLFQTTAECDSYIQGCVSVNPNENGQIIGCMERPSLCEDRKTIDNCVTYNNDCFWNSVQEKCIEINCSSANLDGTPGQILNVSAASCYSFQSLGCLLSNDGTYCIDKVRDCNALQTINNCHDDSKVNGSCFWNSYQFKCYEKTCNNINYTTHDDCNSTLSSCTVNQQATHCMNLASDCSSYVTEGQCKITSLNTNCVWTGSICRNIQCEDAPQSDLFDTDLECQNFNVNNQICTVISAVGYGCVNKKQNCEDYQNSIQCHITVDGSTCVWNNSKCYSLSNFQCENIIIDYGTVCESVLYSCQNDGAYKCKTKACFDYTTIDGSPLTTEEQCQLLDPTCTISNVNQCQKKEMICSNYSTSQNCTKSIYSDCVWVSGNGTCVQKNGPCNLFRGTSETCSSYKQICKSTGFSDTDQCTEKSCTDFNGPIGTYTYRDCQTLHTMCSVNLDGSSCILSQSSCSGYTNQNECVYASSLKCIWDGSQCFNINYQISCAIISNYNSGQLTNEICQSYFPKCLANRNQTNCIDIQQSCENYQNINDCTLSYESYCILNQNQQCRSITPTTQCSELILQVGTSYTHELCNSLLYTCTGNGYRCMDMTCDNKVIATSFEDCQNWLSECTYTGNQKCTKMAQYCNQQTQGNCYTTQEGECVVYNNRCIKKTCEQAEPKINYWNSNQCQTYMNTCTIGYPGGCQSRSNCNQYMSEIQCKFNKQGAKCFWNPTSMNCVDLICNNIEQTDKFDSHDECFAVDSDLQCTVKESGLGCRDRGNCDSYTLESQCHIDSQGQQCIWNTDLQFPVCLEKSCQAAPLSVRTVEGCQLFDINCTVAAILNNGDLLLQGCQQIGDCQNYLAIEQCKINQQGNECVWIENSSECVDKSCLTAPLIYNTDEQCRSYLSNCTVQDSLQGCMEIQSKCELYKIEAQCRTDILGNSCYWTSDNNCIKRSCENAPDIIRDEQGCNLYLQGCTLSVNKCRETVCEDFIYKTDKSCKAKMKTCTTDGTRCVLRGTCIQALSRYGCITQIDGQQCEWIEQQGKQYCTLKQCQTAPVYFNTAQECSGYFHNCIPKSNGGCIKKSTCQAVTVKEGCTTAIDGTKCIWDTNSCRIPICSDYEGVNHNMCNKQWQQCTIGLGGKCQQIQQCQQTQIQQACIIGLDGPCLWIDGACYQYNSCQSIKWTTHEQCQKISKNCTTDGNQCVGVTTCEKTNVNGGCVIDEDGDCYEEIIEGVAKCIKFEQCSNHQFKTHDECQRINKKCTTDGSYACINLSTCTSYKGEYNCKIDSSNQPCDWSGSSCSDKSQILNSCNEYKTKETCPIIDGQCKWYQDQDYCGINCSTCSSSCIQDEKKCIPKNYCANYKNSLTCQQDGLDGICKWNGTSCRLMTQCNEANGQFELCIRNNAKCQWNGGDGKNICTELNCQSNYQNSGSCQMILRLNSTIPILCKYSNGLCVEVQPEYLEQETCFTMSQYTYTWNATSNKCEQCGSLNNVTNQSEPPGTKGDLKVILSFMILFIY